MSGSQKLFEIPHSGKRRIYLHMYFNSVKALDDENNFNELLCMLQRELESGRKNQDHEKQYAIYFDIKTTPARGTKVVAKQNAIADAKKATGTSSF